MNMTYKEYIINLINSEAQNLENDKGRTLLIKHYNSLDLTKQTVDEYFAGKKAIRYVYHDFDGSVMADAYEPFLSSIKSIFYNEYNMSVDEFFEACGVYQLHRSVLKSYFETGMCKRADEVLVTEYQYECHMMQEAIDNMLQYISAREKLVFVFNRLNNANESTIRILLGMIDNEKYNNISIIATYNEMNNILDCAQNLWEEYMEYLAHNDAVVEWSFNENKIGTNFKNSFVFSVEKIPEYMEKLHNMYHMMAIRQAEYYFNLIYKKIEVEELDIPEEYAFDFMELYAEIALMLDNNSDAMIYAEAMKDISAEDNSEQQFRYKYLLSQIYMLSGLNEESKKAAKECYAIAKEQGNEFAMFRAELAHFVAIYSGWKEIIFLDRYAEVSDILLENAKKYGYYNQLAHIYVFAFDNNGEQFREIDNLESDLEDFYRGINLAKSLGNESLLVEGYKKNIMVASTNGLFDICNYYYRLLTEVDLLKNNEFEMANIYNGLGYNNCAAENFQESNEYYNKALVIFDRLKEPEYVGETLYNMAINAMLAQEYKTASEYLETCIFIVKALKIDSLRVCNISKIFGLLTLCYYRLGVAYSSKMTLQSSLQYLDHLYTTDVNAKRKDDFYLWDDDLFLGHYNNALMLMDAERYEESLGEFDNARKYIEASPGFMFFSATQYCIDRAELYKRMGREVEADSILDKCHQFCLEKGYGIKAAMVSMYRDKSEAKSMKWELPLSGISLVQIQANVKSLAVQYSYIRQKHNMEFLTVWQKTADSYDDTPKKFVETSIRTFKNYFNMDYVLFIRFENRVPVVKYDDSVAPIKKEQVDYVVNFFEDNRAEVITSRTEINYYEYRGLMDTVLCSDRINSVIFAPIYKNEKLDSIFISYSYLKESWNSLNGKMAYDKEDLPIFMFFFRELLATIERLEDKIEIAKINSKLQDANDRLSQLATTDMLTGLLNRQGLSEKIGQMYGSKSTENEANECTVMYIDLDNFKYYNDTFGHDIGDYVLCRFSNIISKICEDNGFAIRYGGDEFILIINSTDRVKIDSMARNIYAMLKEVDGLEAEVGEQIGEKIAIPQEKKLSASIGIVFATDINRSKPTRTLYKAISCADEVLYYIKRTEKHRHLFYDDVKDML